MLLIEPPLQSRRYVVLALRATASTVHRKRRIEQARNLKLVHKAVAIRQFADAEKEVTKALVPFFVEQGESIVSRLEKTSSTSSARALIKKVFDPKAWKEELTNRLLPVLARKMAEAGVAHLMALGIDVRKKKKKTKTTTAADWAEENEADWESLVEAFRASGLPMGILNEIPDWMQESIAERLSESFGEDYWDSISVTTQGNAETVLRRGLEQGESIDEMAQKLRSYFLDPDETGFSRYARARSENIARTESGNALNGARKDSVARLQRELGPKVPMKQTWLSVLGNTTRAAHADLDGVPENKNGMWNLAGYMIPWPAHISLPAGQRCNCMCTVSIEFGMDEGRAQELIEEYWEREGE